MLKALLVGGRRQGCRARNKNGPESVGGFPAASPGFEAQPCTGLTWRSPRRPWTLGGGGSLPTIPNPQAPAEGRGGLPSARQK